MRVNRKSDPLRLTLGVAVTAVDQGKTRGKQQEATSRTDGVTGRGATEEVLCSHPKDRREQRRGRNRVVARSHPSSLAPLQSNGRHCSRPGRAVGIGVPVLQTPSVGCRPQAAWMGESLLPFDVLEAIFVRVGGGRSADRLPDARSRVPAQFLGADDLLDRPIHPPLTESLSGYRHAAPLQPLTP